jgi:hypothetical protein
LHDRLADARQQVGYAATFSAAHGSSHLPRVLHSCSIGTAKPDGALQWLAGLEDKFLAHIVLGIGAKRTTARRCVCCFQGPPRLPDYSIVAGRSRLLRGLIRLDLESKGILMA